MPKAYAGKSAKTRKVKRRRRELTKGSMKSHPWPTERKQKKSIFDDNDSLRDDYWMDSFDRLVTGKTPLRKQNLLSKQVCADYNRDSSIDCSPFPQTKHSSLRLSPRNMPHFRRSTPVISLSRFENSISPTVNKSPQQNEIRQKRLSSSSGPLSISGSPIKIVEQIKYLSPPHCQSHIIETDESSDWQWKVRLIVERNYGLHKEKDDEHCSADDYCKFFNSIQNKRNQRQKQIDITDCDKLHPKRLNFSLTRSLDVSNNTYSTISSDSMRNTSTISISRRSGDTVNNSSTEFVVESLVSKNGNVSLSLPENCNDAMGNEIGEATVHLLQIIQKSFTSDCSVVEKDVAESEGQNKNGKLRGLIGRLRQSFRDSSENREESNIEAQYSEDVQEIVENDLSSHDAQNKSCDYRSRNLTDSLILPIETPRDSGISESDRSVEIVSNRNSRSRKLKESVSEMPILDNETDRPPKRRRKARKRPSLLPEIESVDRSQISFEEARKRPVRSGKMMLRPRPRATKNIPIITKPPRKLTRKHRQKNVKKKVLNDTREIDEPITKKSKYQNLNLKPLIVRLKRLQLEKSPNISDAQTIEEFTAKHQSIMENSSNLESNTISTADGAMIRSNQTNNMTPESNSITTVNRTSIDSAENSEEFRRVQDSNKTLSQRIPRRKSVRCTSTFESNRTYNSIPESNNNSIDRTCLDESIDRDHFIDAITKRAVRFEESQRPTQPTMAVRFLKSISQRKQSNKNSIDAIETPHVETLPGGHDNKKLSQRTSSSRYSTLPSPISCIVSKNSVNSDQQSIKTTNVQNKTVPRPISRRRRGTDLLSLSSKDTDDPASSINNFRRKSVYNLRRLSASMTSITIAEESLTVTGTSSTSVLKEVPENQEIDCFDSTRNSQQSILLVPGKWRRSLNTWKRNNSIILDKTLSESISSNGYGNNGYNKSIVHQQQQRLRSEGIDQNLSITNKPYMLLHHSRRDGDSLNALRENSNGTIRNISLKISDKRRRSLAPSLPPSISESSLIEIEDDCEEQPLGVLLLEQTDDGTPNKQSISLFERQRQQNSTTATTAETVGTTIQTVEGPIVEITGISPNRRIFNESDPHEIQRQTIYQHQFSVPVYRQPSIPRRRRRTSLIDDEHCISSGSLVRNHQQHSGAGDQLLLFNEFILDPYDRNRLRPVLSARDRVLRRCNQSEPLDFSIEYSENVLRQCRKIGEGVYGEVFMHKKPTGEAIVLKIIPIEGTIEVNGEPQKKFDEILSEIVIAMELSRLRDDKQYMTGGFVEVKKVSCVQGRYPDHLVELWELYRDNCGTENDHPEIFPDDQHYIVLELANGGQDLEAFTFQNALQSYSALLQTALTLAVAEQKFQFEHRDLHWGNILLAATDDKEIVFRLNGNETKIPTHGVKVTIIDYSLSRMVYDGCRLYNDLSNESELFLAGGDYQFDIYRLMKQQLKNQWDTFEPYTNTLWIHYTIDKMINGARYRCSKSKKHRAAIQELMRLRDVFLEYKSAYEYAECLKYEMTSTLFLFNIYK